MHEPNITIPVSLLLELHAQASPAGRERIETYIRNYKNDVDSKGHVAEGFRKTEEGGLVFDLAFYDEAVYRGKIDTYSKSAKKEIERLKGTLEMLEHMSETQQRLLSAIPHTELGQRVGLGKEISDEDLRLLNRIQPLLKYDSEA